MKNKFTKNQHYVPQILLKGFNILEGKDPKINIFIIQKKNFRFNQPIKNVFSQNYFYDKNNRIENFLESHIETPASILIRKLRELDLSALNSGNILIKFICCQLYRTVEYRENTLEFFNFHFQSIVSDLLRLNNLDTENSEDFRIVPDGNDALRNFTAELTLTGLIDSKAMEDLKLHLLVNKTDREFIISDHPIIRYNWLYKDLDDKRIGSLSAKGIQLFMPLSKNMYLCAYDGKSYKYGTKKSDLSDLFNVWDVDFLNEMQVRGANSLIGYSNRNLESYIKDITQKYFDKKIYSYQRQFLCEKKIENENLKTKHIIYSIQRKISRLPSFIKVLRKAKKRSIQFEERDPELSSKLMLLKNQSY